MSFLSFHFIFSLLWYPPAFADLLKRNHDFTFALPDTMASVALASPAGPVSGYQAPGPVMPSNPLSCCWGGDGLCARFLSHRSVALSIPTVFLASSSSLRQTKVSHTQTWEPKAGLSVPGWLLWLEEVYIMELRMQWLVIKGLVGRTKWHHKEKKRMGNLWKKSSPFSFRAKKLSSRHFLSYLKIVYVSFPDYSLKGTVYKGSVK